MLLQAKEIRKSFRHPAEVEILKGINLEVHAGETLAIMGASGEGKSTLLQILGTLESPSSGQLLIQGEPVTPSRAPALRNAQIGFIFQSFFLLEEHTALQNVLMPARIARRKTRPGSQAWQAAEALLERVGLSHRRDFPVKLLSGGEKQRVAIARALCNDPPLILADEPSGNLDHTTSESIHALLLDLVQEKERTLIAVTHDQTLANMCHRQVRLAEGLLTC
jgi:lipoprotein-releasing system ATP-binding protein